MTTPTSAASPATARVLLVEDNERVRDSMSELIEAFGHSIRCAPDAESALQMLAQDGGAVDVMISDLSLPKMSGLDLTRQVHEQYPQIRLVLATGYGSLIDAGRLGFEILVMPKPIDIDRLADYLDEVAAARAAG